MPDEQSQQPNASPPSDDTTQAPAGLPRSPVPGWERPDRIGRYRVLSVIGEGGFGVVYRAEQDEPVRRQVALKIIKPGMDTKSVIARFEAERQALAVMDHPGIAKIFDGGTTDRGLPYFAMELARGEPITAFCDKNRLGIGERLRLMIEVASAVQHAHSKGVIHRDIKPSNVLVGYDAEGRARPKVIDFGIAKALNQRLTEQTVFTERGTMIGTPEYMSPEQAEMSATDIDTRSDVYSLGVLLYELLSGERPFDAKTLRQAGYVEIMRIIRETDPPKPSTRLSSTANARSVAAARSTELRSLSTVLRRDLDWVCMKCLEKDRERRYETPKALADDLRRFLASEPVLAGPPSASYRAAKFLRRRRVTMGVTAFVVVIAVGAGSVAAVSWRDVQRERVAEAQASRYAEVVWDAMIRSGIDIRVPVEDRRAMYESILNAFDEIAADSPMLTPETRIRRAEVLGQLASATFSIRGSSAGDIDAASVLVDRAMKELDEAGEGGAGEIARVRINLLRRLADISHTMGPTDETIELYEQLVAEVEAYRETAETDSNRVVIARLLNDSRRKIAQIHRAACRLDLADEGFAAVLDEAERLRKEFRDDPSLDRVWTVAASSTLYQHLARGELEQADAIRRELLTVRRRLYERDPGSTTALRDYATALLASADVDAELARSADAIIQLERAGELLRQGVRVTRGEDSRMKETLSLVLIELTRTHLMLGDPVAAAAAADELSTAVTALAGDRPEVGVFVEVRAGALHAEALIASSAGDHEPAGAAREAAMFVLAEAREDPDKLRLTAEQSAELLRFGVTLPPAFRESVAAEGRRACDRLDALGRGCLVSPQVREQLGLPLDAPRERDPA